MNFFERVKMWIKKNKKILLISGTVLLTVGSGIAYVVYNKNKISFDEWLKTAPTEELKDAHEILRTEVFLKTGHKPFEMEKISQTLGERGAKEWFEKHPPNIDPNFRWTDKNRWEKD